MDAARFRLVAGIAIVLSHAALMIGGFALLVGRMNTDKLFATLFILAPVFGIFASQVVNYASKEFEHSASSTRVSHIFVYIFLILYFSHLVLVFLVFISYAFWQVIVTPESLQQALGISETAFGFLVGLMVTRAFGEAPARPARGVNAGDEAP